MAHGKKLLIINIVFFYRKYEIYYEINVNINDSEQKITQQEINH